MNSETGSPTTPPAQTMLFDGELLKQREYWREQLRPLDCAVGFKPDFSRSLGPEAVAGGLATLSFALTPERTAEVLRLARGNDLLLYAIVSGCCKLLLHHSTEATRIAIGSPARRESPEANALPIISRIGPEMTVGELLTGELAALREGYRRQRWPYERMLRDLGLGLEKQNHCPLFEIAITLAGTHGPLPPVGNSLTLALALEPALGPALEPAPEPALDPKRDNRQLTGVISYLPALYTPRTMARFADLLGRAIAWAVADPGRRVGECSLVTAAEEQLVLQDFNRTTGPFPDTVAFPALFEEQAAKTPAAPALLTPEQEISYDQLNRRVNRLARYLKHNGLSKGEIVGICSARIPAGIIAILAVLKAGGVFLPLDPEYPPERLAFMVADAGVKLILSHRQQEQRLARFKEVQLLYVEELAAELARFSPENPEPVAAPDDSAYLIYTSGSTGTPKGARNAHLGLCNLAVAHGEAFAVTPQSRVLQFASWSFDAMVSELAMGLTTGAALCLSEAEAMIPGPPLTALINELGITHVTLPPAALPYLEPTELPTLSHLITAGDFCSAAESRRWAEAKTFYNAYGVTEATVCSTIAPLSRDETVRGVGRPMLNTRVYVLDQNGRPLPVGIPGEIYLGGVGVGQGYLNRPELSAARFLADPFAGRSGARMYKSGDRGRMLEDGSLELIGRIDQQIKLRGFRIEPGEIEHLLEQHPLVSKAVVMLAPEGETLLAFVEAPDQAPNPTELAGFCGRQLPYFMVPAAWTVVKAFPLNANGKIDRKALLELARELQGEKRALSAPRNRTELQLVAIWQETLNLAAVGIRENFFELGGHSLLAIRLLALIQQQLGVKLSLGQLIEHPTIEQLAATLHQGEVGKSSWSHLIPLRTGGEGLPLFCFHPGGGNVQGYLELSRLLGEQRSLYGIQASGFESGQEVISEITTMADRYLAAIRQVRPRGPYAMLGWCFGARVALECAQLLVEQGEEVAYLGLLDAYAPRVIPAQLKDADDATLWESLLAQDLAISAEELRRYRPEEQVALVIRLAKEADLIPDYYSDEQARRVMMVFRANSRIVQSPVTRSYPGSLELFKAQEEAQTARLFTADPTLGWQDVVQGRVTVTMVPGNHNTLVRQPQVEVLARALQRSLADY